MKKNSRHAHAFTLIELLVVIAIIAILIGLLFPAFQAVQNQARKTQAKNDLTQMVTAVNAYYTEYGKYPVNVPSSNTADAYFGSGTAPAGATSYGNNDVLFDVLRNNTTGGNSATVTLLNPRQIVFISPPDVKDSANPRSGIGRPTGTGPGQFFDPWGAQYNIAIDTNYNNVTVAPAYTDLATNYTTATNGDVGVTTGVISWSLGSDQALGTNGDGVYKNTTTGAQSDDVISWQ